MKNLKVSNLTSLNGNLVANQFDINYVDNGNYISVFQSYTTIIAKKENGVLTLDSNALEYSNTTLKYLKQWLNTSMSKKELYKWIEEKGIQVEDLN